MDFCLNAKTGNIMADDRHCIYFETIGGEDRVFIKRGGKKRYLTAQEISEFAENVRFFESRGCDFGKTIHRICARKEDCK